MSTDTYNPDDLTLNVNWGGTEWSWKIISDKTKEVVISGSAATKAAALRNGNISFGNLRHGG